MTAYNHEQYVGDAIRSILRQTLTDFELIVVDDGSEDGTLDVARRFESDGRVVVVPQPRIGRGRALNVAIANSRGEFIAILDADDLAEPKRLEMQRAYLQSHPEVGVLGGQSRLTFERHDSKRLARIPLTDSEMRRTLPRRNPLVHSAVMMPRAVLEEFGGYDETLSVAVDYDLWIRIASRFQLANLPDVLTVQRVHSSAYFQNRIAIWERFKTRTRLRWRALRQFSRNPLDLWYVVNPLDLAQWIVRENCPTVRKVYHMLMSRPVFRATKSR
jgi:glycosyltransferase involved in cell wall biosynthesis